ncbi:MAG TPA: M1 family aminopeptidase [Gemmatimonadales bacterium]|nr:M1 family aminopeptidase [Gemmatimonadales bacterium]
MAVALRAFSAFRVLAVASGMVVGLGCSTDAVAQAGSAGVPGHAGNAVSAASYEERYAEVVRSPEKANLLAAVEGLVIERDVARFVFESGHFYLLTSVGGRVRGAVFLGRGTFNFTPPSAIEQERLARFQKTRSLAAPFSSVVLMFADSTLAELQGKLAFRSGEAPLEVRQRFKDALEYIGEEDSQSLDPDFMSAFLNDRSSGVFYAAVGTTSGSPLMFMLNPHEIEAVSLSQKVSRYTWSRRSEVISKFPTGRQMRSRQITGERVNDAIIRHYRIETWLKQTGSGDLGFAAAAELDITAPAPVGPWIAFSLFEKLRVDSALWENGGPATVFKGKDASLLWVRLPGQLAAGESRKLKLYYRGDLIDRYDDFFFIKSSAQWYPRPLEGRSLATFDLTFHSPKGKMLASVGERVESSVSGQTETTRWVSAQPIRNASFNLGLFKDYRIEEEGIPPVTVLVSEDAHRRIGYLRQKNMKEVVGADMAKSLRFFQHTYGQVPVKQFFATEIPWGHGEAFPGLVHLSWVTFHQTDQEGLDELFRAHEVAHQWWGIGVDFASYHDQWLSEGFATFSGLWYLQTVRKNNEKYFRFLQRWRNDMLVNREERAPIWLGYRTYSSKDDTGYGVMVYNKGAWVLHMLRILMLDLKTMNEDRFTEIMRDFYRSYQGKRASTDDFREVAERHAGADLGWFFDQWVYGTEIPAYRVTYRTEQAGVGQFRVKLQVLQENVSEQFLAYVPITLDLGQDRVARFRVKVQGPKSEIELPLLPASPKSLRFNDLEGVLAEVKSVDRQS